MTVAGDDTSVGVTGVRARRTFTWASRGVGKVIIRIPAESHPRIDRDFYELSTRKHGLSPTATTNEL